jgi:hypothetical protein
VVKDDRAPTHRPGRPRSGSHGQPGQLLGRQPLRRGQQDVGDVDRVTGHDAGIDTTAVTKSGKRQRALASDLMRSAARSAIMIVGALV